MTIWLLAIVLGFCLAGVGYAQGAIRAGFSFFGIVTGALLALPLAKPAGSALKVLGVQHPVLLWCLAPFVVFVIVLAVFKTAGLFAHKKVDVFYKYKAGDLRLALFQRLNARLGACVGLLNALAYLVLIVTVLFPFGYFTTQFATHGDEDHWSLRLMNRVGADLDSTRMARVATALDRVPADIYQAADLLALIYHNPLVHNRLSLYPLLLSWGERSEFSAMASDTAFTGKLIRVPPVNELYADEHLRAISHNPSLLEEFWGATRPYLTDLQNFLRTGASEKFDGELILGRWLFDARSAYVALKKAKPDMPIKELKAIRSFLLPAMSSATLTAYPDQKVMIRALARISPAAAAAAAGAAANMAAAAPVETPTAGGARGAAARNQMARYGLARPTPAQPTPAPAVVAPGPAGAPGAAPTPVLEKADLTGTWEADGSAYKLTFDMWGRSVSLRATIDKARIHIAAPDLPLVFEKDLP